MKTFILISAIILLSFTIDEVPKGVNRIVFYNSNQKELNATKIKNKLNNLSVDFTYNAESGVLKTEILKHNRLNFQYFIKYQCMDSMVVVTGYYKANYNINIYNVEIENTFEKISKSGMNGSMKYESFNKLFEFSNLVEFNFYQLFSD